MKLLEIVKKYVLLITLFLVPVTFAHFFSNFFDLPKMVVLVFGVAAVLLLVALKTFLAGKLTFFQGNFDFPLFLLFAVFLISAIFKTPNKMDAFIFPGPATLFMASILLYFLLNAVFRKTKRKFRLPFFFQRPWPRFFLFWPPPEFWPRFPSFRSILKTPPSLPSEESCPRFCFWGL